MLFCVIPFEKRFCSSLKPPRRGGPATLIHAVAAPSQLVSSFRGGSGLAAFANDLSKTISCRCGGELMESLTPTNTPVVPLKRVDGEVQLVDLALPVAPI